ncbi:50S ribosomal protein L19 [archaeon]|nr:50S ribosomal protein L19 [archaeon]
MPEDKTKDVKGSTENKPAASAASTSAASETPKKSETKKAEVNKKETGAKKFPLKAGATVRVHQMIKEEGRGKKKKDKERVQIFEGIVLGLKHGRQHGTFTVRKVSEGIGVEKIFPIDSPLIKKIEVIKLHKVRQAKANYIRSSKKRLKEIK